MKYLKIFAIMLGVAGFAACSSEDEKPAYNSASDVAVSMAQDEISFKESRGIVKVPFNVTGDANGMITVSCEVKEYGSTPAMDDVHYIVTTKTVNVYPEDKSGYFELNLVDDREINDARMFTITLIDPVGCKIEGTTTTLVSLEDNDNDPYARLGGVWYMHYINDSTGAPATVKVTFHDADEGSLGYNDYYMVSGLFTDPNDENVAVEVKGTFNYDNTTKQGNVTFTAGQKFPDLDHATYGRGQGQFGGGGVFTWNEDVTRLEYVGSGSASFEYLLKFSAGTMYYDYYDGVTYFSRELND